MNLIGCKVLIGVCGGIAAYKSIFLLRLLQEQGAEVRVTMTPSAVKMIGTSTFEALCRFPVATESGNSTRYFEHIDLARWADIFVVCPATANTISALTQGSTPHLLSLIWLAHAGKKLLIPSMNPIMLSSEAVQSNLNILNQRKVRIMNASEGKMACGETGVGRLPEPEDIVSEICDTFWPNPDKAPILICGGRTEESIDPIRYIGNRSTGATAIALAYEFRKQGHPFI
jgi:phosphopantothenoylcysteine decarboxylase / phosphopantothenate---cysteine ligase